MPNCFALYRKGDETKTFVPLAKIDDEICKVLGVTPDPVKYYEHWYDVIGFRIAIGMPLGSAKLREDLGEDPIMLQVLSVLEERFESDAWVEIGRR